MSRSTYKVTKPLMSLERYNTYANRVTAIRCSHEPDALTQLHAVAEEFEAEIYAAMQPEDRLWYEGTRPAGLLLHYPGQARELALG